MLEHNKEKLWGGKLPFYPEDLLTHLGGVDLDPTAHNPADAKVVIYEVCLFFVLSLCVFC